MAGIHCVGHCHGFDNCEKVYSFIFYDLQYLCILGMSGYVYNKNVV